MNAERWAPILDNIDRRLRDPLQLRIVLAGGLLAGWYLLVFGPLSDRIEESKRNRVQIEAHVALARDIESLRTAADAFKDRVPSRTDTNEWVAYLLSGVRRSPVKLLRLEPQGIRKHGPFDLVLLQLELEGQYRDLDDVLAWIEGNPRLLRIDSMNFLPAGGKSEGLELKLTVVGIAN